jgi:hypothetical protein
MAHGKLRQHLRLQDESIRAGTQWLRRSWYMRFWVGAVSEVCFGWALGLRLLHKAFGGSAEKSFGLAPHACVSVHSVSVEERGLRHGTMRDSEHSVRSNAGRCLRLPHIDLEALLLLLLLASV